ncbi:hypothetical protein DF3PB_1800002 [uncultured Defluviicoccus sp.]|uniref:Uncharacterized protein n=1 Tax=metagenome TaxID=256318 RepID=A0A380TBC0_9ZZZZ|nr:hypothetical protein DF3PB_1800002 [uncultured Defluviicoccus sp.]
MGLRGRRAAATPERTSRGFPPCEGSATGPVALALDLSPLLARYWFLVFGSLNVGRKS